MTAEADAFPLELHLHSGPVTPVQLALFAAAAGDHNPLHLDPEAARQAGFERPVVHGMLSMALAGHLFTARLGAGCVRSLQTRFTGVALVGEMLEFTATREQLEGGCAHYRLHAVTAAGKEVLAGSADVALQHAA